MLVQDVSFPTENCQQQVLLVNVSAERFDQLLILMKILEEDDIQINDSDNRNV
jgi:hypothetical protein